MKKIDLSNFGLRFILKFFLDFSKTNEGKFDPPRHPLYLQAYNVPSPHDIKVSDSTESLIENSSRRCVLEYGKDDNDRLTNTLGLKRMGTTLAELQNECIDDQPAYALFRVVSYISCHE